MEVRRRSSGHPTNFAIRLEFVLPSGQAGFYAFNAVSYTHLDVYKRQVHAFVQNQDAGFHAAVGVEHPGGQADHGHQTGIDPVSYTHLDVYKRQIVVLIFASKRRTSSQLALTKACSASICIKLRITKFELRIGI